MNPGLLNVIVYVLVPVVIALICLLTRRDGRLTILVLSLAALSLSGFDFVVYALEVLRVIPTTSTSVAYSALDAVRAGCDGLGVYAGIAAWMYSLFRMAQSARIGWMNVLIFFTMLSLVSAAIEDEPLYFFTRLNYTRGDAIALAFGVRLVFIVTLIYALATRPRTVPVIVPPAPSLYQPMYPQPTPYNMPVSYAPPPPVVLPAPQPQPPTMTTPS